MRFQAQRLIVNGGAADPDPVTNPGDVNPDLILSVPPYDPNGNPQRLALALDAPAAENATVSIYTVDEATLAAAEVNPTSSTLAARRFYLVKSGQVCTGGSLHVIIGPCAGRFYVRMTAEACAADRTLHCGSVPADLIAS